MKRSEEFERFKDGRTVTIDFDDETGWVSLAMMVAPEVDAGEVEITPLVRDDRYWIRRIDERIAELKDTAQERKYFASYKDASNT